MNDLNLLSTFDELAARQPDALARELQDAGIPAEAIQTAQGELRVTLAGMRSALAEKSAQVARLVHYAQDDRRAQAATRKQRELEAELAAHIRAWPAANRDARKRGQDLPKIDERAERQRIAQEVAAYTDALTRMDAAEVKRLRDNLAADIAAEVRVVVQPHIERYARARQRTSAQILEWQRRYQEMLDRPSPETVARLEEKDPADSTFDVVPQADGTLLYVLPAQRESMR